MNFDTVIDRRGTDCLKYDAAERRGYTKDVLPLWVADMDFPVSPAITEALQKRIAHPVYGYSESDPARFGAVLKHWFRTQHGWDIDPEWLVQTPGVVFALAAVVCAFTEPGDAVLLNQPVYYPFSEDILANGRRRVSSDLVLRDGRYEIDFDDLERKIVDNHVKLYLFCSPHNPVGRVWTPEELRRVGDICRRHHVLLASDEIHEDFTWNGHRHTVYASLGPEYAEQCIILTAPSKTFNIAGLQVSNILIPNAAIRERFRAQVAAFGYSQLNTLGLVAGEAALRDGLPWLHEVRAYIGGNLRFLGRWLAENLPELTLIEPEGTYLAWVDFRGLGLTEARRQDLLVHKAGLWLDSGAIFGPAGEGFERFNAACPRATLCRALEQLRRAMRER
ncbi:MAG: MalY/PatB family protein [Succiniclasticum sp.]|jgi:cystathionine beta-lyase|nr:MalY/PatB family protein [Succiniclasticum sp.]MEE3480038.1 MalY/PatB family protein [Succiniclasticum sp.]